MSDAGSPTSESIDNGDQDLKLSDGFLNGLSVEDCIDVGELDVEDQDMLADTIDDNKITPLVAAQQPQSDHASELQGDTTQDSGEIRKDSTVGDDGDAEESRDSDMKANDLQYCPMSGANVAGDVAMEIVNQQSYPVQEAEVPEDVNMQDGDQQSIEPQTPIPYHNTVDAVLGEVAVVDTAAVSISPSLASASHVEIDSPEMMIIDKGDAKALATASTTGSTTSIDFTSSVTGTNADVDSIEAHGSSTSVEGLHIDNQNNHTPVHADDSIINDQFHTEMRFDGLENMNLSTSSSLSASQDKISAEPFTSDLSITCSADDDAHGTNLNTRCDSVIEQSRQDDCSEAPNLVDLDCEEIGMRLLKETQDRELDEEQMKRAEKHAKIELASYQSKKKKQEASKKSRATRERVVDFIDEEDPSKAIGIPLWEQEFEEADEEGEAAQAAFIEEAKRVHKKKITSGLTIAEDIAFEMVVMTERRRRRKVITDQELANVDDMPPAGHNHQHEDEQSECNSDAESLFVSDGLHLGIRSHLKHATGPAQWSGGNNEPEEDDDNMISQALQTKKKGTNNNKSHFHGGQKRKRDSDMPAMLRSTGAKKRKGPRMTDIGSLLTSNPMADAQVLQEGEEDEGRLRLEGRNKDQALKQLLATIPLEQRDFARMDRNALLQASREFDGKGRCKIADDGSGWMIKGMKSSLRHFQMLGSSWMRERESAPSAPFGGLVADDMGMGKTIMMLANIVNGMPLPTSRRECKATLIIVPSTLKQQWFDEIQKHVDTSKMGMVIQWSSSKHAGFQTDNDRKLLTGAFIVLCTYHEVLKSCAKIVFPKTCTTEQQKEEWLIKHRQKFRGLLHQIDWWRVVVDEAHLIKNHQSQTSLAIRELLAKYRWAITGTPIHNSPKELYPYFKFLGVTHTGDFGTFCTNYATRSSKGQQRLVQLLNKIMLRRTYGDKLMGEALVKLPRTSFNTQLVKFNPIERFVYDIIHKRINENIANMAQRGTLHNLGIHHVLTMILRLRQAASHLFLVEQSMRDLLTVGDIAQIKQICMAHDRELDQRDKDALLLLRQMLKNQEDWRAATDEEEGSFIRDMEAIASKELKSGTTGEAYGLRYNFMQYLDNLKEGSRLEELRASLKCAQCGADPAKEPKLTDCSHIYCSPCVARLQIEAASTGSSLHCTSCSTIFTGATDFDPEYTRETQLEAKRAAEAGGAKGKGKGRAKTGKASGSKDQAVPLLSKVAGVVPLPSAKTLAIKAQILNWIEDRADGDPPLKVIVFTQFLPIIDIMEKMCNAEGWIALKFRGDMTMDARNNEIKKFEKSQDPTILTSTLKTGGVGLNLTMASKVIIMDPWWNSCLEFQAFGRVFRIGQKEKTSLLRLIAEDTIDEKILKMQNDKAKAIKGVMEGDAGVASPTIHDLMALFAPDDVQEPFVVADEKENDRQCTILHDRAYTQWSNEAAGGRSRRFNWNR